MFVDSHCHLNKLDLSAYQNQLQVPMQAAQERGVSHMVCIGTDLETMAEVIAVAEQYPNVYATVGTHPLYQEGREPDIDTLLNYAKHHKVIAIGETGLDYYYASDKREQQLERFHTHIEAALAADLPLVVHTRDAQADTLQSLRDHGKGQLRGVLHCFTESLDMAEQALALGFYISISGIVTFRSAAALREVVAAVPMERLLIETDAPWLAPVPHRGKQNEPQYVVEVAAAIAKIKAMDIEEIARLTRQNFFTLFSKAKP